MKDITGTIIGLLMWAYGLASQIMALVFFIDFCKTDSFLKILFIDSWLAEIKGILWIFFIWNDDNMTESLQDKDEISSYLWSNYNENK